MHMRAALAHRGHKVSVHMRNASTQYIGAVEYSELSRLTGQDLDVVVVWRSAGLLGQVDNLRANAGRRYLWLHDVVEEETLRGGRAAARGRLHGARLAGLPEAALRYSEGRLLAELPAGRRPAAGRHAAGGTAAPSVRA
jgi:hypothetical protein